MQTDLAAGSSRESLPERCFKASITGITTACLIGVCLYFFTQAPLLLWEITIGLFLGSLTVRLVSLVVKSFFC